MNKSKMDIAYRIRDLRESHGYSREAFAEIADVSARFLYDIENGKREMSLSTFQKICTAFHVSSDYLLFGKTGEADQVKYLLSQMNEEKRKLSVALLETVARHNG